MTCKILDHGPLDVGLSGSGEPAVDFGLLKNQIFKIFPTCGEVAFTQLYLTSISKAKAESK